MVVTPFSCTPLLLIESLFSRATNISALGSSAHTFLLKLKRSSVSQTVTRNVYETSVNYVGWLSASGFAFTAEF